MTVLMRAADGVGHLPPSSPPPGHVHEWHLQAVWHEDGQATEEYGCTGCSSVTFR
jgi:hypothetical protein